MIEKNLVERLNKENALLTPPFEPGFKRDHGALAGFDVYKAKEELSKKQDLTAKRISELDGVIEKGFSAASRYSAHNKKFSVANEYCQAIMELKADYTCLLQAAVDQAEKRAIESEPKLANYFKLRNEQGLMDERERLDNAILLYYTALSCGNKKGIQLGNSKKVEALAEERRGHAALEKDIHEIQDAMADVSWTHEGKERVESTRKKHYGGFMKADIAKKCRDANFYEGVWTSDSLKKEIDYLITNWNKLGELNSRLAGDAKNALDLLNTVKSGSANVDFFRKNKGIEFNSYDDCREKPYFRKLVEGYNAAKSLFYENAGKKALEIAQKSCSFHADAIGRTVKSKDTSELEKYNKIVTGLLGDLSVLAGFADVSQYWKFLEGSQAEISARIASLNKEAKMAHEQKLERIRANEELRSAKNEFQKQKNAYEQKEREQQKKIQGCIRENQSLTRSLEDRDKSVQEHQKTVDTLMRNLSSLSDVVAKVPEALRCSAQSTKDEIYAKVKDEIKRVEGEIHKYAQSNNALLEKVEGFYSELLKSHDKIDAIKRGISERKEIDEEKLKEMILQCIPDNSEIKSEIKGIRADVDAVKKTVSNLAFVKPSELEGGLSGIYSRVDEINKKVSGLEEKPGYESQLKELQVQMGEIRELLLKRPQESIAQQNNTPQIVYYDHSTNIRTMNVNQSKEEKIFDLVGEVKNMNDPHDEVMGWVRQRILGNKKCGMTEKIKSLNEFFTKETPTVKHKHALEWLIQLRDYLLKEIDKGIIGHHADENAEPRAPFYEVIYDSINPYISRCEQALAR